MKRIAILAVLLVWACNIERNPGGPDTGDVEQVLVAPDSVMLDPLQGFQFGVFGRTTAGDSVRVPVRWSATAGTVTSSGLYAADSSDNDAEVTATMELNGVTLSGTSRVRKRRVTQLVLTPATVNLNANQTQQFTTLGIRNSGDTVSVNVSYSATGGTITGSGLFAAGSTAGTYRVIAYYSRGALADTSTVVVTALPPPPVPEPVASVTVAPGSVDLLAGGSTQLTATTRDSAGNVLTGRVVTWSSSVPGVATVSATGMVSAVSVGSATITATSEGQSGTAVVTVSLVPVASVTVTPASAGLNPGGTRQLTAVAKDSAGNVLTGRAITWSSSATGIATVSPSGLVTGVAAGAATITASSEGKTGSSVVTVTDPSAVRAGRYVSPTGSSSGDGTISRPWDLATALAGAGGRVQPGDTIWLRGGTYRGSFRSSLRGTAAAPIVVRQYPGERATLDGAPSTSITLIVDGAWTVYWGFEIMNSITTRFGSGLAARPSGVYVNGASNVKLVNLIIHDTGHGTYVENTAHNIEIYGWIVYNGGNDNASRSDGHGIYVRNDGTTPKLIADNVIFNQFGFGIHAYAEGGDLLNRMTFDGNVAFNNGELSAFDSPNMILGGETAATNDTVRDNMFYFAPGRGPRNVRIGYTTQMNGSAVVEGNYFIGGTTHAAEITYWQDLLLRNNTFVETGRVLALMDPNTSAYGWTANMHYRDPAANAWRFGSTDYTFNGWRQATGLGGTDQVVSGTPNVPVIYVRPNKYERGRAHVVVYNPGRLPSVLVDLSNVLAVGQRFEIRNVQDIFGSPVVSGVFGGAAVTVPMGGVTPPQPIGGSPTPPMRTGPDFDVFVVTPVP